MNRGLVSIYLKRAMGGNQGEVQPDGARARPSLRKKAPRVRPPLLHRTLY